MPLSWSFVAFMRAWSGYHFSLADRVGVVPVVGVVVRRGCRRGCCRARLIHEFELFHRHEHIVLA